MEHLHGRFAAAQHLGARENQEDDYGLMDGRDLGLDGTEHTLLVLADGMGGHAGGEAASGFVTETVVDAYQSGAGPVSDRLRDSVMAANDRLRREIEQKPAMQGMGSTLVAALISKRGLEWASVGDSPFWLYRDGRLRRLNADHSMAPVFEDMVESGRMEAEEALNDAKRNMLRSAIYGEDVKLIDQSSQPLPVYADDILVLASDGLQTLSEAEIQDTLASHGRESLQAMCDGLIEQAKSKEKSSQDNITVLLYQPERSWGGNNARAASSEHHTFRDQAETRGSGATRKQALVAVLVLVAAWYAYQQVQENREAPAANPVRTEGETASDPQPDQTGNGSATGDSGALPEDVQTPAPQEPGESVARDEPKPEAAAVDSTAQERTMTPAPMESPVDGAATAGEEVSSGATEGTNNDAEAAWEIVEEDEIDEENNVGQANIPDSQASGPTDPGGTDQSRSAGESGEGSDN